MPRRAILIARHSKEREDDDQSQRLSDETEDDPAERRHGLSRSIARAERCVRSGREYMHENEWPGCVSWRSTQHDIGLKPPVQHGSNRPLLLPF